MASPPTPADPARAYWAVGRCAGELRPAAVPAAPGPGEVLVESLFSGVSRGTEALVAAGRVPEGERERMRCPFQEGAFPFPVKYGYAAVGRVAAGPPDLVGRAVFCLHPHQTRFAVPAGAVTPLPEGVPPGRAVLAANLETALNGLWDGGLGPGDRVTVLGAGAVGALAAWLAGRTPGTEVTLVDPDAAKAPLAAALGVGFAAAGGGAPGEADLVIEASGQPAALRDALGLAGAEATVLALGWYGDGDAALPLGGPFHSRRLRLVASQVGEVAPSRRPRWTRARRMAKVLALLADDPALDRLVTGEVAFDALPEALPPYLREPPPGAVCLRVRYG